MAEVIFRVTIFIAISPSGISSGLDGSQTGNQGLLGAPGTLGILSLECYASVAADLNI